MPRELTTYTIEIQKIVEKGFGLGYINNQPVFVSKTTPGDIVDVVIYKKKRKSLFGKVVTVKKRRQLSEKYLNALIFQFVGAAIIKISTMMIS